MGLKWPKHGKVMAWQRLIFGLNTVLAIRLELIFKKKTLYEQNEPFCNGPRKRVIKIVTVLVIIVKVKLLKYK